MKLVDGVDYSPDYAALVDLSSPEAERGGEKFLPSFPLAEERAG